ncbi:MAG: hypothetical protein AB1679_21410 [Actinomycetota bacterium]|jgi:hypothetical protein
MTADLDDRGDWWNFERLSQWDPTHPAAAWATHLLQEAALIPLPCPRCGKSASVRSNLNHLLRDHKGTYAEAATWLEEAEPDLFSLAVHYLATKARSSRQDMDRPEVKAPQRPASVCSSPTGAERTRARGLLPGWCRAPSA